MTVFLVITILALCFGLGAILGAPYLPIRTADKEKALDLAEVKSDQTIIDLGSGDGRMLVAAAKRGANAIGYEINPLLYIVSLFITWRYRKNIKINFGDYWHRQLPEADVIYVFLITRYVDKLDRKLKKDLKKPTTVVSYVFQLPRKAEKQTTNTWVYIYP